MVRLKWRKEEREKRVVKYEEKFGFRLDMVMNFSVMKFKYGFCVELRIICSFLVFEFVKKEVVLSLGLVVEEVLLFVMWFEELFNCFVLWMDNLVLMLIKVCWCLWVCVYE